MYNIIIINNNKHTGPASLCDRCL